MKNSAIGSNWKDVRAELFTKEEILESDLRVAIMTELIEARHEKGISQKKLEELSGVSQPVIARMETGKTRSGGDPAAAYGAVNSCLRRIINRKIFDKQEFLWYERYDLYCMRESASETAVDCSGWHAGLRPGYS